MRYFRFFEFFAAARGIGVRMLYLFFCMCPNFLYVPYGADLHNLSYNYWFPIISEKLYPKIANEKVREMSL